MSLHKHIVYVGIGEEAIQGTPEVSTVGFIPVLSYAGLGYQPEDMMRGDQFRGEDAPLGATSTRRLTQRWEQSLDIPFYTEGGTEAAVMAQILKHFFGGGTSVQNASTGQYAQMFYPRSNICASANLGTKALTLNPNFSHGDNVKNHPEVGARIKSISFKQERGQRLVMTVAFFGQYLSPITAELGSPAFAAENLACYFDHMNCYTGTITRVGSAPDYTDITFGSATSFDCDDVTVTFECDRDLEIQNGAGVNYPTLTVGGAYKTTVEITKNFDSPASGFNPVTEFETWLTSVKLKNFAFHWDTGTQAGTGDNHGLILDFPRLVMAPIDPEFDVEKDSKITLKFDDGEKGATTLYKGAVLLKNTVTAI